MNKKAKLLAGLIDDAAQREALFRYGARGPDYTSSAPWWLGDDFWAANWNCQFGENLKIQINWDIRLDNGTSLLEKNKASHALRLFITNQSHYSVTKGYKEAPSTAYQKILSAIRLVDYFLLHHSHDELLSYGFSAMSSGEFSKILIKLGSAPDAETSIYAWSDTLSEFLKDLIESHLTSREIEYYKNKFPLISVVSVADEDRVLGFDDDYIVKGRIALMHAGYYRTRHVIGETVNYEPDNAALANIFYRETLGGLSHKTRIPELCFGDADIYLRELPSVYVRHGWTNENLSERSLRVYVRRLNTLSLLAPISAAPSSTALEGLKIENVYQDLRLAEAGRFRSVPTNILLLALNRSLTFFIEHSDHLMESFVAVAKGAKQQGVTIKRFMEECDLSSVLAAKTIEMGVCASSLSRTYVRTKQDGRFRVLFRDEYYRLLRTNYGLLELVRVLYGSIALALGLLSARRRSELCGLIADSCVDELGTSLTFDAAKTGASGIREKLNRPIPPIIVRMIRKICSFQDALIQAGIILKHTYLLALPANNGQLNSSGDQAETAIDTFLDYIQMPCDAHGRRYYVRFHQCRRFLPQMFMDSGMDGGIETIQWFLNHTDPEQVWAYILEVSSGDAINQSAAQTATAQLRAGNVAFDELASYLYECFKVKDFWAMDEDELSDYILLLEERGDVRVEMEFIDMPNGRRHRMMVRVIRK